ncbi:uncharacterized protein LOC111046793 [Nilaparvata lugens]|uniref:uncharacterized protein LOC111046793 n=1 Tax=Nilaparvata lugens TaxID=108931 RepID=UPI00193CA288|nr:uncharacterized protein LOC111046793 [Nilaparvata lugens]
MDVAKFDKDRLRIQEKLHKQVKESRDFESLLLLGCLLYHSTLLKMYEIRKKIQVKAVQFKSQEAPPTLDESGMFSDPHETIGPIATSELTFSNQQALLDKLQTSYGYFRAAFQKSEDNCTDLDTYLEILYSNLKLIAHLYTLHFLKENAIEAWKLVHSYGQKFSHQSMRITAVTNLLKIQAQFDNSWTDDALEIADSLPESSTERQLFYIRLASNCMKSSKIAEAVEHLKKVGTKFWDDKVRTNYLLTVGEVLFIPESSALWKGIPSSSSNAYTKASRHLLYMIKSDDWCGYMDHCILQETFVDTMMSLKRYSSYMMMPRLTYYYLTEQSTVVQKLAVPLRLAELLISLAFVDVSVHKKDDCDMKLANVIAILGLNRKRYVIGAGDRKAEQRAGDNVLCLAKQQRARSPQLSPSRYEMLATAPAQNSSPLQLRGEEWTQIVLHSADCVCLLCSIPKYVQLTFDVLLLQAAAHCIRHQFSQAIKYYDDAQVYLQQAVSGKGKASDDWLEGRQAVLYFFYTEMMVSIGNWGAAETGARKLAQLRVGIRRPDVVFGVTADHIMLQRDNLKFVNFKSKSSIPNN